MICEENGSDRDIFDLIADGPGLRFLERGRSREVHGSDHAVDASFRSGVALDHSSAVCEPRRGPSSDRRLRGRDNCQPCTGGASVLADDCSCLSGAAAPRALQPGGGPLDATDCLRSEEHTSELQSLMRISYAVFCLNTTTQYITHKL